MVTCPSVNIGKLVAMSRDQQPLIDVAALPVDDVVMFAQQKSPLDIAAR